MSYLFNNFVGDRSFSEVVAEAKKAGFTEPDPRDDLSGTDVARKVRSRFYVQQQIFKPTLMIVTEFVLLRLIIGDNPRSRIWTQIGPR